jgi:hypothetical protein
MLFEKYQEDIRRLLFDSEKNIKTFCCNGETIVVNKKPMIITIYGMKHFRIPLLFKFVKTILNNNKLKDIDPNDFIDVFLSQPPQYKNL